MSASDVLIRIRLLLAERLSKPPTRGDNQKLSVAIWDLHNVVPNNTELFDIWQALSSSKKDLGRFEQGVRRLTNFLQSSAITGIAPALRTAAAFYNQSVKNDTTGNGDTVIRSGVPFVTPPPPPAPTVTPSVSTRRPSGITVERITPAPSYDDHPFPDVNRRQSGQTQVEIPQSDFTVAAAAPDPELDSFPDDAPPGYTFVAEAATPPPRVPVSLPSPSPPPAPALPVKDTSYSSWQAPPSSDGAGSSQARPSASHTRSSGSSPYAQTSERPLYSPSVTSSSHGVAQSPPKSSTPHTFRPTHTSPSIPVYTPYEPSPTSANASFPQTYDSPSARTTGGPVSSSSSTSAPSSQQTSPPYQPMDSSSLPHNPEPRALRSNATGTSTPYSSGEQPIVNQSWRPSHSSTHSIPAYSSVDPAPLPPPQPPTAMNDAVAPANMHPPSSTSRASALSGSAALYQQQGTRPANSSPVPPTTYPGVPASPPPVSSHAPNQRRSQPVSSPPPRAPQAFSTVAQYNAYPSPTSPATNPNTVASPTTSSFSSIASSSSSVTPVRSDADTQGAPNAQYSWSAVGGAGQQPALSNQYTGGSGQQRPYQPTQYHSANLGMSQPAGGASSRPPMVHSGTPPPQQQAPTPATSYPSPPPSASTASYGQTPLATSQPGAPGSYNQSSGRPPAHHANTTAPPNAGANLQHASWGNRVGQAPSNAPTATGGPLSNQYSGSFPPSPSVPSLQQQPQQPTGYSFPPQGAASNRVGQPVAAQSPQAAALSRPPIHHAATAPLPAHPSAAYAHRGSVGQGNQTMQQPQANAQAAYRPPQFQTGNTATGQPQSSATRPYTTNQINNGAGQPNIQATRPSNAQGPRPHGYTVPAGNLLGTLGSLAGQFGRLAVAAGQSQAPHHAAQAPGYNGRPQAGNGRPPAAGRGNQNQNPLASALGNVYHAYNQHQHQQQQQQQQQHHQQQHQQQQQYQQQQQPQYNNDNGNYDGGGGGGGDGSDQVNYYSNPSDNTYSDPSGDAYYQWPDTSGDPSNTFDTTQTTTGLDNGDTWTATGTDTYDAGGDGGGFTDSFSGVGDMMSGGTGDMFSGGTGDMFSGGAGDMFTGGVGDMLSGGGGDMLTGGGGDMGWGQ